MKRTCSFHGPTLELLLFELECLENEYRDQCQMIPSPSKEYRNLFQSYMDRIQEIFKNPSIEFPRIFLQATREERLLFVNKLERFI